MRGKLFLMRKFFSCAESCFIRWKFFHARKWFFAMCGNSFFHVRKVFLGSESFFSMRGKFFFETLGAKKIFSDQMRASFCDGLRLGCHLTLKIWRNKKFALWPSFYTEYQHACSKIRYICQYFLYMYLHRYIPTYIPTKTEYKLGDQLRILNSLISH
jgi:hypothetical protein